MTSPDPDRLRYARIAGAVARHALGWRLTSDEEAAAVAELTEAAAGRADLLAERAGTALGFGEGRPDAARYRQIAELCIAAGADPALIEQWIKVGRERAATASAIPYTGHPPGGLLLLTGGPGERGRGSADVLRVAGDGTLLAGTAAHTAARGVEVLADRLTEAGRDAGHRAAPCPRPPRAPHRQAPGPQWAWECRWMNSSRRRSSLTG